LTSFSRGVVNNQCFTSFGKANVRVKLGPNGIVAELAARQPIEG